MAGFKSPKRAGTLLFDPAAGQPVNKFGAKPTVCNRGHKHDSKAEAKRCDLLHLLQRAGELRDLQVQPQYWFVINGAEVVHENGRRCGYKADFSYIETINGTEKRVVEDVKGQYRDSAWTLRKAIFRACFPDLQLREVK